MTKPSKREQAMLRRIKSLEDQNEAIVAAIWPEDYRLARREAIGLALAEVLDEGSKAPGFFADRMSQVRMDARDGTEDVWNILASLLSYSALHAKFDREGDLDA